MYFVFLKTEHAWPAFLNANKQKQNLPEPFSLIQIIKDEKLEVKTLACPIYYPYYHLHHYYSSTRLSLTFLPSIIIAFISHLSCLFLTVPFLAFQIVTLHHFCLRTPATTSDPNYNPPSPSISLPQLPPHQNHFPLHLKPTSQVMVVCCPGYHVGYPVCLVGWH